MEPPSQWAQRILSLEVKWLWSKVNHSPPPSAEIKNAWSYTSTPHTPSWHGQGQLPISILNCHVMCAKSPITKTRLEFN
jgi:hypothetical protein